MIQLMNYSKLCFVVLFISSCIFSMDTTVVEQIEEEYVTIFKAANDAVRKGKFDEALEKYQQVIALKPTLDRAYFNMSIAYIAKKDKDAAKSALRNAVKLNPSYTKARKQLAEILLDDGEDEEALEHYHVLAKDMPEECDVRHAHAKLLCRQGDLEASFKEYLEALKLNKEDHTMMMECGNVLTLMNRFPEALEYYERLLALRPEDLNVTYNVAYTLKRLDRIDDAIQMYKKVIERRPDNGQAHFGLATAYLVKGDFVNGWAEYEWRWYQGNLRPRKFVQPMWDGKNLDGKVLYLHAEQGLGDSFQAIRCAQTAKERGAYIILSVQKPLLDIISQCPYIDEIMEHGKMPTKFDVQAPLMSLPYILHYDEETISQKVPYLYASEERLEYWKDKFPTDTFNVGVCWQGNPNYSTHFLRLAVAAKSFPPKMLAPLGKIKNVRFYSLQKDHANNVDETLPEGFIVHSFDEDFDNAHGRFMDTAAVMKSLDLVLTVDTSIAHLAGGLGVPVWVLLPQPADWRWLLDRDDTPWYPNMRLFRQTKPCEWEPVIDEICKALELVVAEHQNNKGVKQ